ncbi:MAG: hypothetical protein Q8L37_07240 [Candidatus Gottesmanbacteria bacterium]|nr:hypothetical protein [Candidatus Gottesmanbacteria bacterium]
MNTLQTEFHQKVNERNRIIFERYKMVSGDVLSIEYGISHQRIHQIVRKIEKETGVSMRQIIRERKRVAVVDAWRAKSMIYKHDWGSVQYQPV